MPFRSFFRFSLSLAFLAFLVLFSAKPALLAQNTNPTPAPAPTEHPAFQALLNGQITVQKALEALKAKERELSTARAKEGPQKVPDDHISLLEQQLGELRQQHAEHEQALRSIAAGVTGLDGGKTTEASMDEQVRDVVIKPLLGIAKDLVARQRAVSEAKEEIATKQALSNKYGHAIQNLVPLMLQAKLGKQAGLETYLQNQKKSLETEKASVDLQLANLRTRLAELDSEKKPFATTAGELLRKSVLHRLGNLLLAVLAFMAIMGISRLLHRFLRNRFPVERQAARPFVWRLGNLFYYIGSVSTAAVAAMLVLYASDDWFLLTLGMLVAVGLALAARHTLPKMYEQAKLLLNLGAVREGERIHYLGLPWLVRRINIYCELINPALAGGEQRIALKNVVPLSSRPLAEGEKWFPTQQGDWILLADGSPAKVEHQSPEFVRLKLNGGAQQIFRTLDFLAVNPRILSEGFRLMSKLQVDFRHAPDVDTISRTLKKAVEAGLEDFLKDGKLRNLIVELSNIGSSALDVIIQSDFDGCCAPKYLELRREVQQIALAAATKHGWIIPYQQLVLHQAGK